MNFGEIIKQLRMQKDWTQEYVAKKLNISVGALSRYETGMYEPKSLDLIKDFSKLFNVSTDFLLGKTNNKENINKEAEKFYFAYHKETEGLSEQEIKDALRFYKQMKKNMKEGK